MRIVFIVTLLVTVSLAAATAAEPGKPENDVARFYDLSACLSRADLNESNLHKLMPMAFRSNASAPYGGQENTAVSLDQIYSLVYAIIGEEYFEHNGACVEEAGKRLFVKCPEEVHGRVSALLRFLEQRLNQTVKIRIDVLDREAPLPDDMDAQALRTALDEGRIHPLFSRFDKVRIGDSMRIRSGEVHRVILDYDTEIAQSSAIAEPDTYSFFVGLDIEAKPMLAADGRNIVIGWYSLFSRLAGPIMVRDIKGASRLGTESGLQEFTIGNALDDPRVEFGSLGATLFLKNGQPALVQAAFPHHGGSGNLLLIVSASLEGAEETMDLDQGLILAAHDLSFLQASKILLIRQQDGMEWDLDLDWEKSGLPNEICIMDMGPNQGPYEELVDLFSHGDYFPELAFDEYAESLNPDVLGRLFLFKTSAEQYVAFKNLTLEMYQPFSGPADVEVLFVEAAGLPVLTDAKSVLDQGVRKGAVSLPLMPGARAVSKAGLEGLMISSYDVDVATKACIMDPNTSSYLDGAMVLLEHVPSVSVNGTGQIRVKMNLNLMKGPMRSLSIAKYGGLIGILDKPEFEHALLDTYFPVDGGMHLLGSLTLAGETGMKTLYAVGRVKK
jgi:hypothetical protein